MDETIPHKDCFCNFAYERLVARRNRRKGRRSRRTSTPQPNKKQLPEPPTFEEILLDEIGTVTLPGIEAPIYEADDEDEYENVGKKKFPAEQPLTPFYNPTSVSLGVQCILASVAAGTAAAGRHDPDGVSWLTGPWPTWDGQTTIDPCTATAAQLTAFVWPNNQWQMRGLRELFYQVNPFKDNTAPTVREIELWNDQVIMHYRKLLGKPYDVQGSRSLYLRAFFADQRKYSNYWDAEYPGECGSAYGPCVSCSHSNTHCGATFIPSCEDQKPYLNPGEECVIYEAGAEAVRTWEMDWPWCLSLSRVIWGIANGEGVTGHGGPFVTRPLVGMSFKCNESGVGALRIKWTGTQQPLCD